MLSGIVIIPSPRVRLPFRNDELLRSLAALVPASVHGLLGDVAIAGPEALQDLGPIAEHAGCGLFQAGSTMAGLKAALGNARYDKVLVLTSGQCPGAGFQLELDMLLRAGVRGCLMREETSGLLTRLAPRLCPVAMLVAQRSELLNGLPEQGETSDPELNLTALARKVRPVREMAIRAINQDRQR